MALSGSMSGSGNYYVRVDWSGSQSVSGNYTTITCYAYLVQTPWNNIRVGSKNCSYNIDGQTGSFTAGAISNNSVNQTITTYLGSYSKTIYHNSDGTKSFSMSFNYDVQATLNGYYVGSLGCSGSFTLNTIARASSVSVSSGSVNIGSAVNINISRASSSFTHNIYVYVGGTNRKSWSGVGTSVSFTPDYATFAPLATNSTSMTATIYCNTYSGGTYIGQKTCTLTIKIPSDSNTKPDVSSTVTLSNQYHGYNLSGIVMADISASATAKYGASISSYNTTFNGISLGTSASIENAVLNSNTSETVECITTAKDSRGITNTNSVGVVMTVYNRPTLAGIVSQRCDSTGTPKNEGTYLLPSFIINHTVLNNASNVDYNMCTVTVKYKKKTDNIYSVPVRCTSGTAINLNLDISFTYDIVYEIQDNVGTTFTLTAIPYSDLISTAFTLMDFAKYGKSMAIGKISEAALLSEDSCFEVGLPSYFYDGLYAKYGEDVNFIDILDKLSVLYDSNQDRYGKDITTTMNVGSSVNKATWQYVKLDSGLAIAWGYGTTTNIVFPSSANWGVGYSTGDNNAIEYRLPPNLFISVNTNFIFPCASGSNGYLATSGNTLSTNTTDRYQMSRPAAGSGSAITQKTYLIVLGWWK